MITFRYRPFIPPGIALCALLSLNACGDTRTTPRTVQTVQTAQTVDPGITARQVVAEYLSLPMTEVALVSLEAREFNNSSLGCPEPGMAYQQVITPGYRASVEAQGRRFDVRITGGHGKICRQAKRDGPARDSGREPGVESMTALARRDLAGYLGVETSAIYPLDIRPYHGNNPPSGCTPKCPGADESCGFIIGLLHDGRRYDYHAVDGHAESCPPISRR